MKLIEAYAKLTARYPYVVLLLVIIFTVFAINQASNLQTRGTAFSKMFPKDMEIIKTLHTVQDEFSGATTLSIAIEIDESDGSRASITDVRDPEVVRYADLLAQKSKKADLVLDAKSAADIIKRENNGIIPDSKRKIKQILDDSFEAERYVSGDYKMTLVRIDLANVEEKEEEVIENIERVISTTTPPPGVKAGISGEPTIAVTFKRSTGPDMQRTSKYAFIGIFIISMVIFASVRHGILPLISVILGLTWAFGLMGLLGIKISSQMAGFASMVMGIGIDFAIQIVSRYREELHAISSSFKAGGKAREAEEAIKRTISGVILPMSTTTIAALVGFQVMSLGKLTIMADLGRVMSLGVLTSMIAAITFVPSMLIIFEKI